jgi:hypothetical protein
MPKEEKMKFSLIKALLIKMIMINDYWHIKIANNHRLFLKILLFKSRQKFNLRTPRASIAF